MLSEILEKKIVKHPDDRLRTAAEEVTVFDHHLRLQAQRMSMMMRLCEGIGLAANQYGKSNSMFVYLYENKNHVCVNPTFEPVDIHADLVEGIEGCLSMPSKWLYVPRHDKIKVSYQTLGGEHLERELEGYEARIYQHEYEHLQGGLIIDHEKETK